MFRKMRRSKQEMTKEECEKILFSQTSGVLAVMGDDDYPYAVPLSYLYTDGRIIFHCAKSGHKLDAIKKNPKASFCVIGKDSVMPEQYTTYFKSVIAFGKMRIVEDDEEKAELLRLLSLKYRPEDDEHLAQTIKQQSAPALILELKIDHLSGKKARELVK